MIADSLEGNDLDIVVAKALGLDSSAPLPLFHSDWAVAGPIIERERISIGFGDGMWFANYVDTSGFLDVNKPVCRALSPIVAAMRCFVAHANGEPGLSLLLAEAPRGTVKQ